MSKITPLMTSLHEGHKAEERIQCIDDMLDKCIDTKFTILQAFWWYRKYTKEKMEKIERAINTPFGTEHERYSRIVEILEQE